LVAFPIGGTLSSNLGTVQRRLNGLGFDTRVTGKFDDATRSAPICQQPAKARVTPGFLTHA
jgi:peptidoglycan hydrolase-like protein with peptidoglycan-binding domain